MLEPTNENWVFLQLQTQSIKIVMKKFCCFDSFSSIVYLLLHRALWVITSRTSWCRFKMLWGCWFESRLSSLFLAVYPLLLLFFLLLPLCIHSWLESTSQNSRGGIWLRASPHTHTQTLLRQTSDPGSGPGLLKLDSGSDRCFVFVIQQEGGGYNETSVREGPPAPCSWPALVHEMKPGPEVWRSSRWSNL